ncbi:Bug family tripartite tricarboxylate transporter substrate binding protein [Comamonas endophytica]|uniref:Tripartite tricarboxylate transporter substrate binding protein n=1 Tax=Comamonas endophytica TaxID=2949090 RepID=A0ABY6G8L1_9BURK|nr:MULTISPECIES: tripartite tricarboxylate transporter substrate binding protein [unclassified Acidovorax]MCD2514247.1 tripartite tricarboxylate transporter substrate binding protein [Acidovorax sp. D4N7]UYG51386.1 tripartite tricarboxylate transporter substrate binding protein [Acidovorax sp. 5MLIR]
MLRFSFSSLPSRRLLLKSLAAPLAALALCGHAQAAFPDKPITLIVPFNAGTTPDMVSRLLAEAVSRDIGQPVVVMNRVGASGIIGTQAVANAPADGYTIGFANVATLAINQSLYKKLPYDADKQLAPVALIGSVQNVLAVRSSLGVKDVAGLVALAKQQPGKLTVASGGNGTTGHLSAEMFKSMAGVSIVHIPYKGGLEADLALLRGEVDVVFENITSIAPHLKGDKAVALAVTGAMRDPRLPHLPTLAESGLANYQAVAWNGYVAPAGVDAKVLDFLNAAFNKALSSPAVKQQLNAQAYEVHVGPRQALFELAKKERPVWADVIRRSGATLD